MSKYTEIAVADLLSLLRTSASEIEDVLINYKTLYVIAEFANTLRYSRQVARIREVLHERLVFVFIDDLPAHNTSDAALNIIVKSKIAQARDVVEYVSDAPRITPEEAKELVASIYGSSHLDC